MSVTVCYLKYLHGKEWFDLVKRGSWNHDMQDRLKERVRPVAYRLKLPLELSCVHDTFHVSNLKKCLANTDLQVQIEEIRIDDKLYFVEEPVEIVDRQVKKLKRSWIPIVKVRWNSRRGVEFTWEREDQIKDKYPQLFASTSFAVVS
ncbi:hypothetical protein Tco_0469747 [Tanacetum coccineum]